MKKIVLILLFICALFVMISCDKKDVIKHVTITCGDKTILSEAKQTDDTNADFSALMTDKTLDDIIYLKSGDTIDLFFEAMPDEAEFELSERLLRPDGSTKYSTTEISTSSLTVKHKQASFELVPNPSVGLSSDTADFEPGATIRGFSFSCAYNKTNFLYTFVLRTDAN